MAALLAPMAAQAAGGMAEEWLGKFARDPLGEIASTLLEIGTALLVTGIVASSAAYLLSSYGQKSLQDAANEIGIVVATFNNVQYSPANSPMLPILGSNPAQDVSNFGNDIWNSFGNAGADVASGLSALSTAVGDIPKALLLAMSHGPMILWDGLVGVTAEALGDILTFLFPWMILFGAFFLAGGLICKLARYAWGKVRPDLAGLSDAWMDRLTAPGLQRIREATARLRPKPPEPPVPPEPILSAPLQAESPGAMATRTDAVLPRQPDAPAPEDVQPVEEVMGESSPAPSLSESKDRLRLAVAALSS